MNRKQRRTAAKLGGHAVSPFTIASRPPDISELLTRAVRHHQAGQLVEAEGCYRKILAIDENHFHGLHLFGVLAQQMGRSDFAERLIRKAIALNDRVSPCHNDPLSDVIAPARGNRAVPRRDLAHAHSNFSIVLMSLGRPVEALRAIQRSIELEETDNSKLLFVQCLQALNSVPQDIDVRDNLARALSEPWGRAIDLARFAANVIKRHGKTGAYTRRFTSHATAKRTQPEIISTAELSVISGDPLLRSLLEATFIFDIELERYLTAVRNTMLLMAIGNTEPEECNQDLLRFFCALSRQCFINEYVFACSNEEKKLVEQLQALLDHALDRDESLSELWLLAVAAYRPLASLPAANFLARRRWSSPVAQLVAAHLQEVEQERQLCGWLPCLTAINEHVSLAVQRQYEDNPYPRWVKASPVGLTTTIYTHLREQFPNVDLRNLRSAESTEILVAGCGTGQHSIETARRFKGARVLAIDLSRASLSYAMRKTQELGLKNVEYAQADILQLGGIGRTFDVIEASGVLHHLSAPMAGWRVLLSMLRPGGFMRLGLYSKLARRELDAARAFIAQRGYGRTAEEIRRCRQELASFGEDAALAKVLDWGDFYNTSECRDLLFHVQEHQISLPEIEDFLRQNELRFFGFILSNDVRGKFRSRFPNDTTLANLASWHIFETENPATFRGMYQFWVQKAE
jgi:2-polyprenyl-3-methyl-5-hydroxy-6-metoxy-1,4-benzoquinol methylase/tetratricopeptide (TPR) repeat protein